MDSHPFARVIRLILAKVTHEREQIRGQICCSKISRVGQVCVESFVCKYEVGRMACPFRHKYAGGGSFVMNCDCHIQIASAPRAS